MGVFGGLLVTTGLTAMIIMPKIIMFSKQHRIAKLLEAQAIEKANITYTSKESKKARKKTQTSITPRKEMRTGPSFYSFYLRQPTTL